MPCGTTGESPTLSHAEHHRVVEACIAETKGRVPVIAGAGSNNTAEAIDLAVHAEKAGANGVLIVSPYYNKPNQEGLYRHFKAINDAIGIPIIMYNIPPRSVIDISVDTMKRLFELKNIAGVKDATGNVARISLQREAMGEGFIQLSGEDMTALSTFAAGRPRLHLRGVECCAFAMRAVAERLERGRSQKGACSSGQAGSLARRRIPGGRRHRGQIRPVGNWHDERGGAAAACADDRRQQGQIAQCDGVRRRDRQGRSSGSG